MLNEVISRYREFLIYCLIGCCGVTLDCVVFAFLTRGFAMHYQIANVISVSCGICNNFFLNAFLNFRRTDRLLLRFISFYTVGLTGLGLSAFLLWLLIGQLTWNDLIAKVSIVFIVTILQFTLNKCLTFKKGNANVKE
ncbi:MAG: GtrA family protein [Kiritimatiellia bacterium]